MKFIPLIKPFIGQEEEQEVINTLRSGVIGTGPKTQQFEGKFAAYVGRKYAIGIDSCTNALHISLVAMG
ncbi:MAG: DegT/DnrJ/EryC1/StrS family aminotransferase, partial [Chloroflexota bacterium]